MLSTARDSGIRISIVERGAEFCIRSAGKALALVMLLWFVPLFDLERLNSVADLEKLIPERSDSTGHACMIRTRRAGIESGRLVPVSGKASGSALETVEQIHSMLDTLKQKGDLAAYSGPFGFLPCPPTIPPSSARVEC